MGRIHAKVHTEMISHIPTNIDRGEKKSNSLLGAKKDTKMKHV